LRRQPRRGEERPSKRLARQVQAEDLALLVIGREIADQRDLAGNVDCLLQREHREQIDLLVAQPIRPRALDAVPRPAAAAVDLAALDREIHLVAAGIAGDELDLGAKQVLQEAREAVRLRSRSFAGTSKRRGQSVWEGL